jgi:hypothetical protein
MPMDKGVERHTGRPYVFGYFPQLLERQALGAGVVYCFRDRHQAT